MIKSRKRWWYVAERLVSLAIGTAMVAGGAIAVIYTIDLMPPASYWCGIGIFSIFFGGLIISDCEG